MAPHSYRVRSLPFFGVPPAGPQDPVACLLPSCLRRRRGEPRVRPAAVRRLARAPSPLRRPDMPRHPDPRWAGGWVPRGKWATQPGQVRRGTPRVAPRHAVSLAACRDPQGRSDRSVVPHAGPWPWDPHRPVVVRAGAAPKAWWAAVLSPAQRPVARTRSCHAAWSSAVSAHRIHAQTGSDRVSAV